MHEYTLSLAIWIAPIIACAVFFAWRRLLTNRKQRALAVTIGVCAAIGCVLDLFFARAFFTFPVKSMTLGCDIAGVPVEEFIFYVTGFWFIVFAYVFCDEWFLLKYNVPDERYARFARKLRRSVFPHRASIIAAIVLLAGGIAVKSALNPAGSWLPGYFTFLLLTAYIPAILFYRVTRAFVNWRGFVFSLVVTALIAVIWEVTLALPRGYWGYQPEQMLGIFIAPWHDLPIEAVSVWVFSTFAILLYEWLKIAFFTVGKKERRRRRAERLSRQPSLDSPRDPK